MPTSACPHPARRVLLGQALAAGAGLLLSAHAMAQSSPGQHLSLSGSMGGRALLMIDGKPRTLAVGASHEGVRLVALEADGSAVVESGGKRVRLPLGGAPASIGEGPRAGAGTQVKLVAGPGGHFIAGGSINGRAVQFMVDTGATNVALGEADASRLGLDLSQARSALTQTANGVVTTRLVKLSSVRLGDVEVYNVDATVLPHPMSHVLLGNSFLTRFQMRRENDVLTLDKRL